MTKHNQLPSYTLDGRTQTLRAWSKELDIGYQTLHSRLLRLGWSVERALTTPVKTTSGAPVTHVYTHEGRTQELRDWAKELDMGYHILYGRFRRGWSVKRALTTPRKPQGKFITYDGQTQRVSDWAKELGVHSHTLHSRLNAGWTIKEAFTTPLRQKRTSYRHPRARLYTYDGRTQSLLEWARELGFAKGTLISRLKLGWTVEQALSLGHYERPVSYHRQSYTYQGKTQTLKAWSQELDIAYRSLYSRLRRGWPVEKAFATPLRSW